MIGVACAASQRDVACEFFEHFKTPWEFLDDRRAYEVVLSTVAETPAVEAGLLVVSSPRPAQLDARLGIGVRAIPARLLRDPLGGELPIYGELAALQGAGSPLLRASGGADVAALEVSVGTARVVRAGYDLFGEIGLLLAQGQPAEHALVPTFARHIARLRDWILRAGIPVIEIPPVPCGHSFMACLTHDVDFVGIRRHKLDHTLAGFVYRALIGSIGEVWRGRRPLAYLLRNWAATASLPLVYLGLLPDFWDDFEEYAALDADAKSTFFLIPYKNRPGANVPAASPERRAARYEISEVREKVQALTRKGFEIGLHGIDAWHSAELGAEERQRIAGVTGQPAVGARIHWLCFRQGSAGLLEQAGFAYDSTLGYNDAVGYRSGTAQAFLPRGCTRMLELPLHIQDTALFYPGRMALSESEAWERCARLLDESERHGGALTVLWHVRSLGPERQWRAFYVRLLDELRRRGAWFGTAAQVVRWYEQRRSVVFEGASLAGGTVRVRLRSAAGRPDGLCLRVYRPRGSPAEGPQLASAWVDVPWNGEPQVDIAFDGHGSAAS